MKKLIWLLFPMFLLAGDSPWGHGIPVKIVTDTTEQYSGYFQSLNSQLFWWNGSKFVRADSTGMTEAEVEDLAGGMWTGNTETRASVTYQTADNTFDIVVDDMNYDGTGVDPIVTSTIQAKNTLGLSLEDVSNNLAHYILDGGYNWLNTSIMQGAQTFSSFDGTVSTSGTTVTFSSEADAKKAGWNSTAAYRIVGGAITAAGEEEIIISWTNSTTATLGTAPSVAWSGDNITSVKWPISIERKADGTVLGVMLYNGYRGIGTASPVGNLNIYKSPTVNLTLEGARGSNVENYANIDFKNTDAAESYVGARIAALNDNSNEDGALLFYTYNGSLREWMRITSTGNFGIWTTNPAGVMEWNLGTSGFLRGSYNAPTGSATDYWQISTDANGSFNLTTVDSDGAAGDITLAPDGDVVITTGKFIRKVTAGITAVNPGGQGDGPLTSDINEVSTVGTADDAITLPSAEAGLEIKIINNGANQLEIWPATGDDAGAGVNTAITLAAGSNLVLVAYDVTNWETF